MPFHQCKHILIRNITASHILVNTLLLTLVKTMFGSQFDKAEKLLGETPDPLLVYGVEVSIQMYIAELSEPLRELYVVGYSLPTTSEYIYMRTAQKIQHIFSQYIKEAELKDFYEMDIASAGITRGFMAKKCDLYFTMENKLRRLLKCSLLFIDCPSHWIIISKKFTASVMSLKPLISSGSGSLKGKIRGIYFFVYYFFMACCLHCFLCCKYCTTGFTVSSFR